MQVADKTPLRRPDGPGGGDRVWSIVFGNAIGNSVVDGVRPSEAESEKYKLWPKDSGRLRVGSGEGLGLGQSAADEFGDQVLRGLAQAQQGTAEDRNPAAADIPFDGTAYAYQSPAGNTYGRSSHFDWLAANDIPGVLSDVPFPSSAPRDAGAGRGFVNPPLAGDEYATAAGVGLAVDPSKLPRFWTSNSVGPTYAPRLGMNEVLDYFNPVTRWEGFKDGFSIGGVIDGVEQFLSDPLGSLQRGGLAMQQRTREYIEAGRRGDFGAAARYEGELAGSEAAGLVFGLGVAKGVGLSVRAFNAVGGATSDLVSSTLAPYTSLRLGADTLGSAAEYGVAFFGASNLGYYTQQSATIGRAGKPFFFMPLADSGVVRDAADAARYTGRAPSAEAAYLSGGDVYGLSFRTDGMKIRMPTAADAGGWPHFLEGGNTAVRLSNGPNAGYLVNPTREFVTLGGSSVPRGSTLFKLGPNGSWQPVRRW